MAKKSIDQLREEANNAAELYKDHQSPFLYNKALEAKEKLDNALKSQMKKNYEPVKNQISLL